MAGIIDYFPFFQKQQIKTKFEIAAVVINEMVARQSSLILSTTWFHFVHIICGQWLVKPILSNNQGDTDTNIC